MWKSVLVGAFVISIGGSSIVCAQQRDGEDQRGQSSALSQEDETRSVDARLASRLASLKERLRLTPEQEKNWPAYELALRAVAKQRRERMESRQEEVSPSESDAKDAAACRGAQRYGRRAVAPRRCAGAALQQP